MSARHLLVHRATVARPTATTGIKKTFQTVASNVVCFIQPLDDEAQAAAGSAMGKRYHCYFELSQDVREGDRITDQTGVIYFLKGLRKRPYGRSFPHIQALLFDDKRP